MNYKAYLQSEHWRIFRRKIYSERNTCQKCSRKNVVLNLHHRNYNNLGKETNEDVIVLCQECHHRFHSKTKWKIAMKKGKDLDFTITSQKNKKRQLYNMGDIKRKCKRCGEMHPIFYKEYQKCKKRLAIACPNSKPRITFLPYEEIEGVPTLNDRTS